MTHHARGGFDIAGAWVTDNVGYATACNFMAAHSHNDIIGLINADVWMSTQDVADIQIAFDSDPSISILGPKQRNEENRIVHAGIIGSNIHPLHRGWQNIDTYDQEFREQTDCVTVSGAAYFIRRQVWDELTGCPIYKDYTQNQLNYTGILGAFLPTPLYYEETWCSYHARAHGHRVVYDGRISIGHTWHASSPRGSQSHKMEVSRGLFRAICDAHSIARD